MTPEQLEKLLTNLRQLSTEKEWVEFKSNKVSFDDIGEYISALSNTARLKEEAYGYMVWGIEDQTHNIVGTTFIPEMEKQGNEELEHWLVRSVIPHLDICFQTLMVEGKRVVILKIPATLHTPVRFQQDEFIRVGSLKKKLKDYPEKEREIWKIINISQFEKDIAQAGLDSDDLLRLLNYPKYFELTKQPLSEDKNGILEKLQSDFLITSQIDGWSVTNLGAILFAKNLNQFGRLSRKSLRVIHYEGKNRIKTKSEELDSKGYAVGFEGAIDYINNLLPKNEEIGQSFRRNVRMYPEIAVRELVANALIHQDFSISGTGPMVEIFDDRIEITNPGAPLIDTLRMMDQPPRSRNESLAALMRRMDICEERGSGIDKVIDSVELYQLPAPKLFANEESIVVTLYAYQSLKHMDKDARIRACYQHACLKRLSNEDMTNASLRKRFNIGDNNAAQATRILMDTIGAELIKVSDPQNQSRKHTKYLPFWA